MRTNIAYEPVFTLLTIDLERGEEVKAEPGAMVAQFNTSFQTGAAPGGLFGGIRRMLAGESFLVNTFTGRAANSWVKLAPPIPGDIIPVPIAADQELFLQPGAFLASTPDIEISSEFQGLKGAISGEGMFFLRLSTNSIEGTAFICSYGSMEVLELVPDDELVVDNGHVVGYTTGISYTLGKVGGLGSALLGGEGLVMKFRGSGQVWIQTRELASLASSLAPHLPQSKSE